MEIKILYDNVVGKDWGTQLMGFTIAPTFRTICVANNFAEEWETDPHDDKFFYYRLKFPHLFFLVAYTDKSSYMLSTEVFVFCKNKDIKINSKLKILPLPNIGTNGLLCMGCIRTTKQKLAQDVISSFFSLPFNSEELDLCYRLRERTVGPFKKWTMKKSVLKVKWPDINYYKLYCKKVTPKSLKMFFEEKRMTDMDFVGHDIFHEEDDKS